jgi:protein involved in polysaccharide export with SLBB domain
VVLIRRDRSDHPMLRVVDLKGFVEGSDDRPDVPLVAGDIVFVPRNEISEVDMWIDQFITRFLPFNRSFSYAFNKTGAGI